MKTCSDFIGTVGQSGVSHHGANSTPYSIRDTFSPILSPVSVSAVTVCTQPLWLNYLNFESSPVCYYIYLLKFPTGCSFVLVNSSCFPPLICSIVLFF